MLFTTKINKNSCAAHKHMLSLYIHRMAYGLKKKNRTQLVCRVIFRSSGKTISEVWDLMNSLAFYVSGNEATFYLIIR